jgi:voltage-gated potassium channel
MGVIPTVSEADARTVMTAMTLNNIAKGALIAAEILDASMDQYLKLAHVNEIIYSRDYSRLILAKASMGTGVTNIFHELINPKSSASLTTRQIPDEFLNSSYEKLCEHFKKKHPGTVLLGILENSGNSFVAKEKALRRAQQTPNVSQLVNNLQAVKNLKFNQPVFGPRDEYVIREGSMAIVIISTGAAHA